MFSLITCHLARVLDEHDELPEDEHNVEDYPLYYNCLYFPELFIPSSSPDFAPVFLWVAPADMDIVLSLNRLNKCDLQAYIHNLTLGRFQRLFDEQTVKQRANLEHVFP